MCSEYLGASVYRDQTGPLEKRASHRNPLHCRRVDSGAVCLHPQQTVVVQRDILLRRFSPVRETRASFGKLHHYQRVPMFDAVYCGCYDSCAGWSSLVARWAHNPKVGGSNPPPATKTSFASSCYDHPSKRSLPPSIFLLGVCWCYRPKGLFSYVYGE